MQTLKFQDSIEHTLRWIEGDLKNKPLLIKVAGPSCAGKTTFADNLISASSGREKIRSSIDKSIGWLPLDDFFRDLDDPLIPRNDEGLPIFDVPESYCSEEYSTVVAKLLSGEECLAPVYNLAKNRRYGEVKIKGMQILVTEGLFSIDFCQKIPVVSLSVYVEADRSVCEERRVTHDMNFLHIPEDVAREHFNRVVWPLSERYVVPQRELAHLVVRT